MKKKISVNLPREMQVIRPAVVEPDGAEDILIADSVRSDTEAMKKPD